MARLVHIYSLFPSSRPRGRGGPCLTPPVNVAAGMPCLGMESAVELYFALPGCLYLPVLRDTWVRPYHVLLGKAYLIATGQVSWLLDSNLR